MRQYWVSSRGDLVQDYMNASEQAVEPAGDFGERNNGGEHKEDGELVKEEKGKMKEKRRKLEKG